MNLNPWYISLRIKDNFLYKIFLLLNYSYLIYPIKVSRIFQYSQWKHKYYIFFSFLLKTNQGGDVYIQIFLGIYYWKIFLNIYLVLLYYCPLFLAGTMSALKFRLNPGLIFFYYFLMWYLLYLNYLYCLNFWHFLKLINYNCYFFRLRILFFFPFFYYSCINKYLRRYLD